MPASRPPVLILMTDQQRADALGCAGHAVLRTPHMDRVADEGVRFDCASTVSPVCMPARASFVSGLYPHNHGIWRNGGELPADDETFFHHLQRAGYHVAYIGKSHFYPHRGTEHVRERENWMRRRGIDTIIETTGPMATAWKGSFVTDRWETKGLWQVYRDDYDRRHEAGAFKASWPSPLPEEDHLDTCVGRAAVEFIDRYDGGKPLCLFVGFGGPHDPWDPPARYAQMYDPADCPAPIPAETWGEHVPEHARAALMPQRPDDVTDDDVRRFRALYYAKVTHIDDWFGRILAAWDSLCGLDETLTIHWSDHGEMLGDHGRVNKNVFYAGALDMVLNVRWPGRTARGAVCHALAETIDVFPTVLEAAGLEPSRRCLGRSLMPCLADPGADLRDTALSEVGNTVMARTARWKYACDTDGRGLMLFDLENDPQERRNGIGLPELARVEREMRDRMLGRVLGSATRQ